MSNGLPEECLESDKESHQDTVVDALKRDGWTQDPASKDATITYIKRLEKPDESGSTHKRIVIHYHAGQVCGPRLIKGIIEDVGWTTEDLKRLKLVK
jgi:predicted RNA binding protein YcfA (HicA-like mRNA interferase family)